MSDDTPTTPNVAPTPVTTEPRTSLWGRIPRRLFGGRVRTTTAALVVLFLGALVLYGALSDHYADLDEQARQETASQVQQARTPTPEPVAPAPESEYTETPESTLESSTLETTDTYDTNQTTETTEQVEPDRPLNETVPPPTSTSESTRGLLPQLELPTRSIAP